MTNEQAMREEIEHLKAELDAAIKRAQAAEGERDSLAASLADVKMAAEVFFPTFARQMSQRCADPDASLARLKAQWCEDHAERFMELADNARDNGYMAQADAVEDMAQELRDEAAEQLRRQAEADQ